MKRKIMLLLALQSITILTLNETSCFCFRKKTEINDLIDISEKVFKEFKASNTTGYNELYVDVWTQISGWADPVVTIDDIENDKKMNIIIYSHRDNTTPIEPTDTGNLSHNPHRVTIEVKADDSYFQVQEETEYFIDIGYPD